MFGVVGQHMLHPFAGEFTEIDSLIFAFIASGIYFKKKKRKKRKLHHPLGLDRSQMPDRAKGAECASYLRYRFRGLCDKILNEHLRVEESLGVDQTMLDQDLLWTKNIYIDLHQICSG